MRYSKLMRLATAPAKGENVYLFLEFTIVQENDTWEYRRYCELCTMCYSASTGTF